MRIVHVANFYGPNSGGIKTMLHELGKGYLQHGHEFIYIVPGTQHRSEMTPSGLKVTMPSYILPGNGGYRIFKRPRKVKEEIAKYLPDRLEISDRFTLISIGRWARKRGIPNVAFSHESLDGLVKKFIPSFLPRNIFIRWHNRYFASSFDSIIATTEFASREFRAIKTSNLRKVSLGVDLENFSPGRYCPEVRSEIAKGSEFLLLHCGRLSPEKNPLVSIDALIELRRSGIDARLIIIGIGPLWHKMRKAAKGHPVDFLGYVADRNRVATIMSSVDLFLAPGPLETFCLAALESLASGTPVIASKSSAVHEFLDLNGIQPAGAIASDFGSSFAAASRLILGNWKFGHRARQIAESMSWEKSVQNMLALHNITDAEGKLDLNETPASAA